MVLWAFLGVVLDKGFTVRRSSTASPWARGLVTGLTFGLVALVLSWGAQTWQFGERRGRAEASAASLADMGAQITGEWMARCQGIHGFLALRGTSLVATQDLGGVRPALEAALASHRDSLRAAVLVDTAGQVLVAASAWRVGTRPDWVPGTGVGTSIEWRRTEDGGWFVAHEALAILPGAPTPLRLITAWDPADLSRRLSALLANVPTRCSIESILSSEIPRLAQPLVKLGLAPTW